MVKTAKVGGAGGFDYVFADAEGRRLYIARTGPAPRLTIYRSHSCGRFTAEATLAGGLRQKPLLRACDAKMRDLVRETPQDRQESTVRGAAVRLSEILIGGLVQADRVLHGPDSES